MRLYQAATGLESVQKARFITNDRIRLPLTLDTSVLRPGHLIGMAFPQIFSLLPQEATCYLQNRFSTFPSPIIPKSAVLPQTRVHSRLKTTTIGS